jgi:ATP/ADP translocase
MRNRVLHFLGVEAGEESMVSLLLYQSVFLGLFYGAFDISAHSLFLAVFDETIMARAYVVSGLAGIVLTTAYSFFQTRIQFKNFSVVNLLIVTLLTLLLWLVLIYTPSRFVVFALFVMMGPLNILALLGFWGTTGRLFTLRQGKRLFGLVDAGLIVGIIISSYGIPALLAFGFNIHNIILLSAFAVLCAAVMQFSLGRTHTIGDTSVVRKGSVKTVLTLFRKDTYVLNMGWYVSLSVVTAFFIQYSFMAVTREQFPLESDMARFLGLFIGSMMIFTLFLKTFLFSYLIKTYGLKIILLLPPVLIMLFTAVAAGLGSVLGYTPASGGFILFFILLALSRLFSKALKDSVETPSFKVIYQTLSDKIRYNVQSIVDGTVNEIAALISGLLLSVLGIIVIGRLVSFSWVLLVITALWAFFGFRLYLEYRKSIIRSLDEAGMRSEEADNEGERQMTRGKLYSRTLLRMKYPELINQTYTVFKNDYGEDLAREMVSVSMESGDPLILDAVRWVSENDMFSKELKDTAKMSLESLQREYSVYKDPFVDGEVRPEALELITGTRAPHPALLLRILRDSSAATRRIALMLIARHDISDMIPEVCELLPIKETFHDAIAVLDHFGVQSYGELYRYFMKSSGNITLMKNLLILLGKNCYQESEQLIYQLLRTNSRDIRGRAASILVANGFRIAGDDSDKMHQLISDTVGTITWYIQALVVLARAEDKELSVAVKSEMDWWNDFLFSLLSITYDRQSVKKIRENLETGTIESINFALEMIDIVLDDSIKARVAYCLDISDNEEKLKSLYSFYPGFIPSYGNLLIEIINRDYNLSDVWTKSIAIRSLGSISDSVDGTLSLSALLFSPNSLLVEEAVCLLKSINEPILKEISGRVPPKNRKIIEDIVNKMLSGDELLTSKIRFLMARLSNLSADFLIPLAEKLDYCSGISGIKHSVGRKYYFGLVEKESHDSKAYYYRLTEKDVIEYISFYPEYLNEVSAFIEGADVNIP